MNLPPLPKKLDSSTECMAAHFVRLFAGCFPDLWRTTPKTSLRQFLGEMGVAGGLGPGRDESTANLYIRELRRAGNSADTVARIHFGPAYEQADKVGRRDMRNEIRQRWRIPRKRRTKQNLR